MTRARLLALGLSLFAVTTAEAQTAPADNVKQMIDAIARCWRPPDRTKDFAATLRFSVNATGAVIGRPLVTYSKLGADDALNRAFMASIVKAMQDCTPVAITPRLGGAIAGRPFFIRFRQQDLRAEAALFPTTRVDSRT